MKIDSIQIQNIRGITQLELEFNCENALIFGNNATGKSSIVDSIDFLFTGDISRTKGIGTRDILLNQHGPHRIHGKDAASSPKKAFVRGIFKYNGQKITLTRDFANKTILYSEPKDDYTDLIQKLKKSFCIVTRDNITKFIKGTPKERAELILSLLHSDMIENYRLNFETLKNSYASEIKNHHKSIKRQYTQILQILGYGKEDIEVLLKPSESGELNRISINSSVLNKVNIQRTDNNISPIDSINNIKYQMKPPVDIIPPINIEALNEIFEERINSYNSKENIEQREKIIGNIRDQLSEIMVIPEEYRDIRKLRFLKDGLQYASDSLICPLCNTEFETQEALQETIQKHIDQFERYQSVLLKLHKSMEDYTSILFQIESALTTLQDSLEIIENKDLANNFDDTIQSLQSIQSILDKDISIDKVMDYMASTSDNLLQNLPFLMSINDLYSKFSAEYLKTTKPLTDYQKLWDLFTDLTTRFRDIYDYFEDISILEAKKEFVSAMYSSYIAARNDILNQLFDNINNRFLALYRTFHQKDDPQLEARLIHPQDVNTPPSRLDFYVNFHDDGEHPPHAMHSEGHQDSMGIAMFLAIIEYLQKQEISLIVFDDVVNTIDIAHRRPLCEVLASQFDDLQFIITTHDKTFKGQLQNNGVVDHRQTYVLFGWSLLSGPKMVRETIIWDKIDSLLKANEMGSVAHTLRKYSEEYFYYLGEKLEVMVPLRSTLAYGFDELFRTVFSTITKRLKEAKNLANRRKNNEEQEAVEIYLNEFKDKFEVFQRERWKLNPIVHYNEWETFSPEEIRELIEAMRSYIDHITCSSCSSSLMYSYNRSGFKEVLRCSCGKYLFPFR